MNETAHDTPDDGLPTPVISAQSVFCTPRELPPLKAALFDWDQTLAHSNFLYRRTREATFRELFGDECAMGSDFKSFRGCSVHGFFINYYRDRGEVDWEQRAETAYARFLRNGREMFDSLLGEEKVVLFEGARKTIQGLIDKGIPVAVVSNAPQEFISEIMMPKLLGEPLASQVLGIGLTFQDQGKPETDTCHRALNELKARGQLTDDIPPSSIYFVGDSAAHDVEVAYRMGFTPVLYGEHDLETFRTQLLSNPDAVAPSMRRFLHVDDHAQLQSLFDKALEPSQPVSQAISR